MRVLLLGRSGFVGKNMLAALERIPGLAVDAPSHAALDVLDEAAVVGCLSASYYDVVLNCLDVRADTDEAYAEKRLRMYFNLAAHSDLYGKMIWFGSGAEYGRQIPLDRVSEEDFGRVIPSDSYGFALYQMSLHTLSSDNIYNFRLFGIFGPHEVYERRFISNCVCRALCGYPLIMRRNRVMDYLYVDDLARIVLWAMSCEPSHHAYNACSGKRYELLDIAEDVRAMALYKPSLYVARDGFDLEYTGDNSLLAEEMGLNVPPLYDSIEELWRFYEGCIEQIDKEKLLFG